MALNYVDRRFGDTKHVYQLTREKIVQHSLLFSLFSLDKMQCTVNLDTLPQSSFEWLPSKHFRVKYCNFQDDWKKDEAIRCKNTFRSSKNLQAKLGLICPIHVGSAKLLEVKVGGQRKGLFSLWVSADLLCTVVCD